MLMNLVGFAFCALVGNTCIPAEPALLAQPTVTITKVATNQSFTLTETNIAFVAGQTFPNVTYTGSIADLTHPNNPESSLTIIADIEPLNFTLIQSDKYILAVNQDTKAAYTIQWDAANDGSLTGTVRSLEGTLLASVTAGPGWKISWPPANGINLSWLVSLIVLEVHSACDPSFATFVASCNDTCKAHGGVQAWSYKCTGGNVDLSCICWHTAAQ